RGRLSEFVGLGNAGCSGDPAVRAGAGRANWTANDERRNTAVAVNNIVVRTDRYADRVADDRSRRPGCQRTVRLHIAVSKGPEHGLRPSAIFPLCRRTVRLDGDA